MEHTRRVRSERFKLVCYTADLLGPLTLLSLGMQDIRVTTPKRDILRWHDSFAGELEQHRFREGSKA